MPQGRSKAFSGKAKKAQIQAKRNRGNTSQAGVFSRNFLWSKVLFSKSMQLPNPPINYKV